MIGLSKSSSVKRTARSMVLAAVRSTHFAPSLRPVISSLRRFIIFLTFSINNYNDEAKISSDKA
jgi:hypothetical protein